MEELVLEFAAVILAFFAGMFLMADARNDSPAGLITPLVFMVLAFFIVQLV